MYKLITEIYGKKLKTISSFEKYENAVSAVEHIADVLKNVMTLTRHSSCEKSISHCGYYGDHYNELFIYVKKEN